MPDMIIKIDVQKPEGGSHGKISICLYWKPFESSAGPLINEWALWDSNAWPHQDILWDESKGVFDIKTWDVMWLWAQDTSEQWQHVFILREPPTSRYDDRHLKGVGRIYTSRNSYYSGWTLKWKVKCLAGCYIS